MACSGAFWTTIRARWIIKDLSTQVFKYFFQQNHSSKTTPKPFHGHDVIFSLVFTAQPFKGLIPQQALLLLGLTSHEVAETIVGNCSVKGHKVRSRSCRPISGFSVVKNFCGWGPGALQKHAGACQEQQKILPHKKERYPQTLYIWSVCQWPWKAKILVPDQSVGVPLWVLYTEQSCWINGFIQGHTPTA